MTNYKIDFTNKKIIVSKGFYKASQNPNNAEFTELMDIMDKLRGFEVRVKETKPSPRRRNPYKGLTYSFIRRFIHQLDPERVLDFENQMLYYEGLYPTERQEVFLCVRDWFLEKYPRYKDLIVECAPKSSQEFQVVA